MIYRWLTIVAILTCPCAADEFDAARLRAERLQAIVDELGTRQKAIAKQLDQIIRLLEDDYRPPPPLEEDIVVRPGESINGAIARVPDGGTVVLRAGIYKQMISPRRGNFTIRGDGEVILAPTSGARCAEFAYLEASDITVRNLIFDGSGVEHECVKLDWRGPDPSQASQRITFKGCTFRNGPHSGVLTVGQSRGHRFIGCRATSNGLADSDTGLGVGHGFYISSSDVQLIDCEADANGGWGVHPFVEDPRAHGTGRLVNIVIRGLKSHHNGWYGAGLYRGDGNVIEDSSFWANGRGGIEVGLGAKGSIVRRNHLYRGNGIRYTDENAKRNNEAGVSRNTQHDTVQP